MNLDIDKNIKLTKVEKKVFDILKLKKISEKEIINFIKEIKEHSFNVKEKYGILYFSKKGSNHVDHDTHKRTFRNSSGYKIIKKFANKNKYTLNEPSVLISSKDGIKISVNISCSMII